MWRKAGLAVLLAMALGVLDWTAPGPIPAQAASGGLPASGSGVLVYVQGNDIWTMNADGSNPVRLTQEANGKFANSAVFSPDGTKIAYGLHAPWTQANWGGSEIHVMNADGTNDQVVAAPSQSGEWMDMPAWYGGGASMFYTHDVSQFDAGGQWLGDLMTIDALNLATGERSTLLKNAQAATAAPNGGLAWVSFVTGTLGFQLNYTADGSTTKTLLSDKDFLQIYKPRLSPDGQWIAFSGSGRKDARGNFTAAADNPGLALVPRAGAHGLPWDPYVMKVDGTGLRRLAAIGSDEQALSWSPDGQTVALAYFDGIFQVSSAGGPLAKVLSGGEAGGLDWKPIS